jgi:hypothetical protein
MTTSWKEVINKLKMNGYSASRGSRSDTNSDADTVTSGTPQNFNRRASAADSEWQMNYIINRRDGL